MSRSLIYLFLSGYNWYSGVFPLWRDVTFFGLSFNADMQVLYYSEQSPSDPGDLLVV